jgi:glucosamine--fructose-6-phosphate aminotransferase (isomerizing)
LKHGPFALIDPETVVVLLAPDDDQFGKMIHAASEIHSRHARIILITNQTTTGSYDPSLFEDIIFLPLNPHFQTILGILPLQLLAYELSVSKGYDPDFPRNLAKVVTVDG